MVCLKRERLSLLPLPRFRRFQNRSNKRGETGIIHQRHRFAMPRSGGQVVGWINQLFLLLIILTTTLASNELSPTVFLLIIIIINKWRVGSFLFLSQWNALSDSFPPNLVCISNKKKMNPSIIPFARNHYHYHHHLHHSDFIPKRSLRDIVMEL